ncbi:hypothetical protein [Bremerella sp.]|uniref:hypothetical protein n=1 Tax=Bremerella sp. TaxID=2795602 RepID=UPI003919CD22
MDALKTIQSQLDVLLRWHPHWLVPRTGNQLTQSLKAIGAGTIQVWRHWEDPENDITRPSATLAVDSETSGYFNRQWREEAFGFHFPELAYLPEDASDNLFTALTRYCHALVHAASPSKAEAKSLSQALLQVECAMFPLAVSPFMAESATDYALVLIHDPSVRELMCLELTENPPIVLWQAGATAWPIPAVAEEAAQTLWESELAETC